jgi:hypothetical protein
MSDDLQENHNEIMAKLSFVNDLAECVMELAMAKGAPLNTLSESNNWKQVRPLMFNCLIVYVKMFH